MVQVHNDDHEDYVETYRNEKIVVPSRSFLDMERSKAIGFLGSFSGQACGHDFLSDEELDVHISVHHKAEQIKDKPNAKGRKR